MKTNEVRVPAKECFVAWCKTCGEFLYVDATEAAITAMYESGHCDEDASDVLALRATIEFPSVSTTSKRGEELETAARTVVDCFKSVGGTGALYLATSGVETERAILALRALVKS